MARLDPLHRWRLHLPQSRTRLALQVVAFLEGFWEGFRGSKDRGGTYDWRVFFVKKDTQRYSASFHRFKTPEASLHHLPPQEAEELISSCFAAWRSLRRFVHPPGRGRCGRARLAELWRSGYVWVCLGVSGLMFAYGCIRTFHLRPCSDSVETMCSSQVHKGCSRPFSSTTAKPREVDSGPSRLGCGRGCRSRSSVQTKMLDVPSDVQFGGEMVALYRSTIGEEYSCTSSKRGCSTF